MDDEMANRVNQIKKAEKLLDILYLFTKDELEYMYSLVVEPNLREKMDEFQIQPSFNFTLWQKLKDFKGFFNYMKISKKFELKEKWFKLIVIEIPEILSIFDETNRVFDYFKDSLNSLFSIINYSLN